MAQPTGVSFGTEVQLCNRGQGKRKENMRKEDMQNNNMSGSQGGPGTQNQNNSIKTPSPFKGAPKSAIQSNPDIIPIADAEANTLFVEKGVRLVF
jgi:hypothetical protein